MKIRTFIINFLATLMGTSVAIATENCFVDGSKMFVEAYSTSLPDYNPSLTVWEISGTSFVGGNEALMLWSHNPSSGTREFRLMLRVDGSRIWFYTGALAEEWVLLYDFSLQPGEVCRVGYPRFIEGNSVDDVKLEVCYSYLKCVDRICTAEGQHEYMLMNVCNGDDDNRPSTGYADGIWLAGIGSDRGIVENSTFLMDGYGSVLRSVVINDDDVYVRDDEEVKGYLTTLLEEIIDNHGQNTDENGHGNGVEPNMASGFRAVAMEGKVIVTGCDEGVVAVFDLLGREVCRSFSGCGDMQVVLTVGCPGMYVVKNGRHSLVLKI